MADWRVGDISVGGLMVGEFAAIPRPPVSVSTPPPRYSPHWTTLLFSKHRRGPYFWIKDTVGYTITRSQIMSLRAKNHFCSHS